MAKKSSKHPGPRASFKFAASDIRLLVNQGLSADLIEELEQAVWSEWVFIYHARDVSNVKERRRELEKLKKAVDEVKEKLSSLDKTTIRRYPMLWVRNKEYERFVEVLLPDLDEALSEKGRVGNVETDLDVMAYQLALTLYRREVRPQRYGEQFQAVMEVAVRSVGENQAAIRVAIDKAWTGNYSSIYGKYSRATQSIEDLLEFGEPDDGPDLDF